MSVEALAPIAPPNKQQQPKPRRPRQQILAVATPTLGKVSMYWTMALMDLAWPLNCTRTVIPMYDLKGGEIAEARNRLVAESLRFETPDRYISHLFWLDDDVLPHRCCLIKLLGHNRDIASGVYFGKLPGSQPLIFNEPGNGTMPFVPNQTFEAWGWAQGLCTIKLEVYKHLRDEGNLPLDKYGSPAWYHTPTLADATFEDGTLAIGGTEDMWFFRKCNELGYRALVDTSLHTFGWHYDADSMQGYPVEQWKKFRKQEPVTWDTPDGPVTWE